MYRLHYIYIYVGPCDHTVDTCSRPTTPARAALAGSRWPLQAGPQGEMYVQHRQQAVMYRQHGKQAVGSCSVISHVRIGCAYDTYTHKACANPGRCERKHRQGCRHTLAVRLPHASHQLHELFGGNRACLCTQSMQHCEQAACPWQMDAHACTGTGLSVLKHGVATWMGMRVTRRRSSGESVWNHERHCRT